MLDIILNGGHWVGRSIKYNICKIFVSIEAKRVSGPKNPKIKLKMKSKTPPANSQRDVLKRHMNIVILHKKKKYVIYVFYVE